MKIFSKKYFFTFYLLFFLIYTESLFSQSKLDSLDFVKLTFSQNSLSTILEKQLNTYNLSTWFRYSAKIDDYILGLSENFRSSYIKGIENTARDENQFQMFVVNQFNKDFDLGIKANNSILSDSRRLEINQSSISSILLFSRFKFFNQRMIVVPNLGFSNNTQIGENDNGAEYGLELETKRLELSDFDLDSEIKFKNEDISPRKNYVRLAGFKLLTNFDRNIFNSFNFRFSKNRKDFYFPADSLVSQNFSIKNNIQSRAETQYLASNKLVFIELLNNLNLESESKLSFRKINREIRYKLTDIQTFSSFDSEVDELKLEFDASLIYNSEKFKSNFRILLSERDEKNKLIPYQGMNQILFEQREESEEQKNNTSFYGTIALGSEYLISDKDRISFNLYQSKLKYDTPSILNHDDRDEILTIIKLEYYKILNPFFSLFTNIEGSQAHLVYIFASKSSNNNINRVIRLKTGSELNSSQINSVNIFEVSANYTSYDFEDLNSNLRSFSYRQFTALDSTQINLTKRILLNFHGYIKISEQGDFSWKSFSERPKRYLRELFLEPKLSLTLGDLSFGIGVRYFDLSTFNYKDRNKIFDNSYSSYGPVSIINGTIFKSLTFNFWGYYEIIKLSSSRPRSQGNMNLNINWNF